MSPCSSIGPNPTLSLSLVLTCAIMCPFAEVMGGKSKRDARHVEEEDRALVEALASALKARGLPYVLPRLPSQTRSATSTCWSGENGAAVLDAAIAAINAVRASASRPDRTPRA